VFTNRVENDNALAPQSHGVGPCSEGWLKSWKKSALQSTRSTTGCPALGAYSIPASEQGRAKKSSKTKFTCPDCGQNAWAKPDALLICGECFDEGDGDICFMLAEQ
jgi:hypothetical protein